MQKKFFTKCFNSRGFSVCMAAAGGGDFFWAAPAGKCYKALSSALTLNR
jgi:hypothetical protein